MLLAACGGSNPKALPPARHHTGHATTTTLPATTTTSSTLPITPIAWTACGADLQCGSLTVPLNYADPTGTTIQMAVERHLAEVPGQRIGSLVINPGGPGVSGLDDFSNELSVLTPGLLDDFDIVTFDPRGVQRSDPVTCGETPGSAPGPLPDQAPQTAAAQAALIADFKAYAAACDKASGSILPYVGTVDTARDLDRLRAALGDATLTYMGQSYGTLLGATYAQLFPTHIRAMVLDSAIDPAISFNEMSLDQAESFEHALGLFFSWCASTSACAWTTTADPTAALNALLTKSRVSPSPASGGRSAGPGELYNALLYGLYSTQLWSELGSSLASDADGNGEPIVSMSNTYNTNNSTNADDAATAIDCLDHPVSRDLSTYPALAAQDAKAAPIFGPLLAWSEAGCAVWPVLPSRVPGPVHAPGAPPILVVATTNDPATPYAWGVSLSHELDRGVLLTRDGDDHVAYFYSACVRSYVQTYLISLVPPATGTVCTS
jgi:pimeloyl-ACP methyl ester carboxylesterase